MKKIIHVLLLVFPFFLYAMEHQEVVKKIETVFGISPDKIFSAQLSNQITKEDRSVWIDLFVKLTNEIKTTYFFTIANQWYTYFDLSLKPILDQYSYYRYLQEISLHEGKKIKLHACNNENTLLLYSHGAWKPFIEKTRNSLFL
jgi:hypothetical protein